MPSTPASETLAPAAWRNSVTWQPHPYFSASSIAISMDAFDASPGSHFAICVTATHADARRPSFGMISTSYSANFATYETA